MAAETLSLVGDQLLAVALPLFVLDRTGSTSLTAATALVRVLPLALLGAVGGAVVDRSDRRRLLIRVSVARSVLVLPILLVVSDLLPLGLVFAVVVVLATLGQAAGPAVGASLPLVVSADDLPGANARLAARTVAVQLAAPTAGAVLYAHWGLSLVVAANALLYAAASLAWLRMPRQSAVPASANRLLGDTVAGWQLVRRDPVLRGLLAAIALSLVGLSLELSVLVPFTRDELGGSVASVGLLTSLEAAGGLMAAGLLPLLHRRLGLVRLMRLGMMGLPAATVGFLLSRNVGQAIPGVVAAGLLLTLLTAAVQVHLQRSVTPAFLGRVLGIIGSTIGLAAVVGSALAIGLASFMGLRAVLAAATAAELVGVALYVVLAPGRSVKEGRA